MPEARDRQSGQDGVLTTHISRRRIVGGVNISDVTIMEDEDEDQATGTSFRWRGAPMGTPVPMGAARGRSVLGSPRIGRSPKFGRSTTLVIGRENISPLLGSVHGRGGLQGRGSQILPAWYPRKPLREITAVVRAIERRRARREEGEGLETESSILQDQIIHDPCVSTSVAQLEQDLSVASPFPTIGFTHCPLTVGKVPKILLNITNQSDDEDSTCLTPQKKLLNNIETFEREVMEELHKLKRTPSAKKDERQKRVKTLMSMR